MPGEAVDVVVIGAGVVGAAVLQRLTASGLSAWIVDKGQRVGGQTTQRNSGVIHAGLYYPADSLKTRLCIRGNRLTYAWAQAHRVPVRRCGKLVVARDQAEEAALVAMLDHAKACDVEALRMLTRAEMLALEPTVLGRCAVFSGTSGVVDPHDLTVSLVADAAGRGAQVLTQTEVTGLSADGQGWLVATSRGPVRAQRVVNAAGLFADEVARMAGIDDYTIYPCRGDYFWLRTAVTYRHLVYPMKAPNAPNLGIHLTLDIDGGRRLGPDATWVDSKTDYGPAPGKRARFAAAAATLLDGVTEADLAYDSCGLRPKLRSQHEPQEKDFVIAEERPGFISLMGIESPGLTSALAIAEEVEQIVTR